MQKKHRILLVCNQWQTFVEKDYKILSKSNLVQKLHFRLDKGLIGFISGQLNGIFRLIKKVPKNDIIYIWFCDYHAFWTVLIAKLFNKKSIIVVGGFDAVAIPSLNYGLFTGNSIRKKMAVWAYSNCDKIIAVDKALLYGPNEYAPTNKTGIVNWVDIQQVRKKSKVIPTGYSTEQWKGLPKKNQVLTVALIKYKRVYDIKGIDLFLNLAKQLPQTQFILVGLADINILPIHYQNLPNLKIYPIVSQDELINLFAESKVYCQFSITEGLPNVLCEAMMSKCVPVGSAVNGIPIAIGDTGYVIDRPDIADALKAVQLALDDNSNKGELARQRIIEQYSIQKRENALNELFNELNP